MNRIRSMWHALSGGLWFLPTVLVCCSVGAALLLVELQSALQDDLAAHWPRLFGAGAEGARGMLSAIATSMVTVAGVVFSVTIVALSLAASQYSPRVLRNFMADRPTQVVLGAFVGVFTYCLIVLRTIRNDAAGGFVPSIAVLGGVIMALVGVGLLIYFIDHVAKAIQVPYIVSRITRDTTEAIDRLFPAGVGAEDKTVSDSIGRQSLPSGWRSVPAPDTGYLVAVDAERLLDLACRMNVLLRILPRVGDFIIEGLPLAEVAHDRNLGPGDCSAVQQCFVVRPERDVHQDAPYGLQQLVDLALKALSPSTHDPTTAVLCIDQLSALLVKVACRRIEGPYRRRDGELRLIVCGAGFEDMVEVALAAVTHHAGSHAPVHESLIDAVECTAIVTSDQSRRAVLARRLDDHRTRLRQCDLPRAIKRRLVSRARTLARQLRAEAVHAGVGVARGAGQPAAHGLGACWHPRCLD